MKLKNPEKYTGCVDHPAQAKESKQVLCASIKPCFYLAGWYDLTITFVDNTKHYGSSDSVRGCKQQFAFQCSAGSKWED